MNLYLASHSITRKKILEGLNIDFQCIKFKYDEEIVPSRDFCDSAIYNARGKALSAICLNNVEGLVIAADTYAVFRDKVYGKPGNRARAKDTLRLLAGETHTIYTGLCVCRTSDKKIVSAYQSTKVKVKEMSEAEIDWFVKVTNPIDKAPGYTIEGMGALIISEINGSYENVLGLPIGALGDLLRKLGADLKDFIRQ